MPTKNPSKKTQLLKIPRVAINFDKIIKFLAFVFFVIWISVGLFFLLFIYGNWRQGAFRSLLSPPPAPSTQGTQAPPTETTLPGIGKVNIECVQSSLSSEAIQKIVTDGNTSKLTDEEKAKFEPCIIEAETATPEASPAK